MTDYEHERATFQLDVPDHFNATRDVVDARAATHPDAVALLMVSPDGRQGDPYTFAELRDRTSQVANVGFCSTPQE